MESSCAENKQVVWSGLNANARTAIFQLQVTHTTLSTNRFHCLFNLINRDGIFVTHSQRSKVKINNTQYGYGK